MSATIKEIAKDVGVTKMAIIGRMKRIPGFYANHTRKDINRHNMVIIDDAGVQKLKSLSYNTDYGNKSQKRTTNKKGGSHSDSANVRVLKTRLADYQRMIEDKRDDLLSARSQIKQLNRQVDNAQKLELLSKQENQQKSKSYEAKITSLNKQLKELPSHSASSSRTPKKKSFWQRWFGSN